MLEAARSGEVNLPGDDCSASCGCGGLSEHLPEQLA